LRFSTVTSLPLLEKGFFLAVVFGALQHSLPQCLFAAAFATDDGQRGLPVNQR
jgi:hypothetical protein